MVVWPLYPLACWGNNSALSLGFMGWNKTLGSTWYMQEHRAITWQLSPFVGSPFL